MIGNRIPSDNQKPDNQYTLINPDGKYSYFDTFSPVYAKNQAPEAANRSMSSIGERITFFKFLNDTLFSMEKGKVTPIYKLSLKQKMPNIDAVARSGPFDSYNFAQFCYAGGYCHGFFQIFETERYITLIPWRSQHQGYYWIDKKKETGYYIPSSALALADIHLMTQGLSIPYLVDSNEKELISSFPAHIGKGMFSQEFTEHPEIEPFSPDLKPFWESVDPDGNPCLIIYEH